MEQYTGLIVSGSITKRKKVAMAMDFLFSRVDWSTVQNYQKRQLADEVDAIDATRLLNTSVDDLCDDFEGKDRGVPDLLTRERNSLTDRAGSADRWPRQTASCISNGWYSHRGHHSV